MPKTHRDIENQEQGRANILRNIRETLGEATQEDLEALIGESLMTVDEYRTALSALALVDPSDKHRAIADIKSLAQLINDQRQAIYELSAIVDFGEVANTYGIGQTE
jgi:hypothetical protein